MTGPTRRRALLALASTALAPALVPALGASPAAATTEYEFEVVADGLDNPRGLAFGADGALYVAEAGRGGDEACFEGPEGEACVETTGAVTRVDLEEESQERVVTGLPSLAGEDGGGAVGPSDVAVTREGDLLVTVGLGADPAVRPEFGPTGARLGTVQRVDLPSGAVRQVADVAAFEAAENPDESDPPDSNPNALLQVGNEVLVADAGGNTVVAVDAAGAVSTVAVFPTRDVPAPPGIPDLPPTIPMQAVPTSLAVGPDGQVLVGQLTGFPFPIRGALVYQVDPAAERPTEPEEFSGGFTNIIDVAQREDDTFVLEIATNSLLAGPNAVGALARLRPDGSVQRVGTETLAFPGGMTVGPDGALYISNRGTAAGEGQVLRLDPSLAGDEAIQAACPPDDLAFPPFADILASVHEEAIACLWWWGITEGRTSEQFQPDTSLTRGQTASMLVRAARQAGVPLPPTAPDAFTDDEGSVHETNIDILAAAGLMDGTGGGRVEPDRPVTRAQLAALLVRAVEMVLDEQLPAGTNAFTDDDGTTHEADINTAAAAGWVVGVRPGVFAPDRSVSRGQTASIMMRAMSDLVEAGVATLPDPVSAE